MSHAECGRFEFQAQQDRAQTSMRIIKIVIDSIHQKVAATTGNLANLMSLIDL